MMLIILIIIGLVLLGLLAVGVVVYRKYKKGPSNPETTNGPA